MKVSIKANIMWCNIDFNIIIEIRGASESRKFERKKNDVDSDWRRFNFQIKKLKIFYVFQIFSMIKLKITESIDNGYIIKSELNIKTITVWVFLGWVELGWITF